MDPVNQPDRKSSCTHRGLSGVFGFQAISIATIEIHTHLPVPKDSILIPGKFFAIAIHADVWLKKVISKLNNAAKWSQESLVVLL